MSYEEIQSSREYHVDLVALRAFHWARSRREGTLHLLREFHQNQAEIITQKIQRQKNIPWTWETFIEAYKR